MENSGSQLDNLQVFPGDHQQIRDMMCCFALVCIFLKWNFVGIKITYLPGKMSIISPLSLCEIGPWMISLLWSGMINWTNSIMITEIIYHYNNVTWALGEITGNKIVCLAAGSGWQHWNTRLCITGITGTESTSDWCIPTKSATNAESVSMSPCSDTHTTPVCGQHM